MLLKIDKNRFTLLFVVFFFAIHWLPAQELTSHAQFYKSHLTVSNSGMYVLGGWALANIATGAYGWSRYSGEKKYFYQMNLFWNVVNLSIAGIAVYNNFQLDYSEFTQEEVLKRSIQLERTLLINSGLDIAYIGTGFLLRHFSGKSEKRKEMLLGYGNSLILQGAYLLVFDLVLYGFIHGLRMDFLTHLEPEVASNIMGAAFTIRF